MKLKYYKDDGKFDRLRRGICSYFWGKDRDWKIEGFLVGMGVIGLLYLDFLAFLLYIYWGQQARIHTCLVLPSASTGPLSHFLLLST